MNDCNYFSAHLLCYLTEIRVNMHFCKFCAIPKNIGIHIYILWIAGYYVICTAWFGTQEGLRHPEVYVTR